MLLKMLEWKILSGKSLAKKDNKNNKEKKKMYKHNK